LDEVYLRALYVTSLGRRRFTKNAHSFSDGEENQTETLAREPLLLFIEGLSSQILWFEIRNQSLRELVNHSTVRGHNSKPYVERRVVLPCPHH
jgi:hypothetical protein